MLYLIGRYSQLTLIAEFHCIFLLVSYDAVRDKSSFHLSGILLFFPHVSPLHHNFAEVTSLF